MMFDDDGYEQKEVRCTSCGNEFFDMLGNVPWDTDCLKLVNDNGEWIHACPYCNTDEYLLDIEDGAK